MASNFDKIPENEEIRNAAWSYNSSKAPRYDGFNFKFVKECWDTIGDEICKIVKSFFITGFFDPSINTTWVTLIPKNTNPLSVKEYMAISTVGCLFKFISKILATRIKLVMGNIVSGSQTGFVQVR